MSVLPEDLKLYGSTTMADDDTPVAIGAAISLSRAVQWIAFIGLAQAVSSDGTDTTQSITVSYLDGAGVVQTITIALNGTTVVTNATSMTEVLKGIKSATTAGDVAVESQTAVRSNTAQGGTTDTITLDAGASAVDDFYRSMIVRLTGGTGANQIRQVVAYNGTTKVAIIDRTWSTPPDGTSTFRIADGFMFDKLPSEILEVRRPFYNVSASASLTKTYYEKVFFKNTNGVTTLTAAQVIEQANPTGKVAFALETTLNAAGTNGGGNNRQVAPSSGVTAFSTAAKTVATGQLTPGDAQGCWLQLTLSPGDIAQLSSVTPRLSGTTT